MHDVNLKGEDFSTIHNALCDLRRLTDQVAQSALMDATPLAMIVRKFEEGLQDAWRQDHEKMDGAMDYWRGVADQNGFSAIWSMYEIGSCNQKHGFTNDCLYYKLHWGEEDVIVPVQGDTYLDLYRAADEAIKLSGDQHHVFIEDVFVNDDGELELSTGS